MTEHNHRRGTRRKRYPKVEVSIEIRDRKPGVTYIFCSPARVVEEGPDYFVIGTLVYEEPLLSVSPPRNAKAYGYADKGGCGLSPKYSALIDRKIVCKGVPCEYHNGNRGMAKAVRGAKKYINSRFRFHEKAATRRLADSDLID